MIPRGKVDKERLGIPLFIYEDGSKTLELSDVLARIRE